MYANDSKRPLYVCLSVSGLLTIFLSCSSIFAQQESIPIKDSNASSEKEMKKYTDKIPGTDATFTMTPIPSGTFLLGSPETEQGRRVDEGPQVKVSIDPFWMGIHEVTWDEFDVFTYKRDIENRKKKKIKPTALDKFADTSTRPTMPYLDMSFGMGREGFPAACMTQFAAIYYCKWLSLKTGRYYRLPTEAEWEYACRAGTNTKYSFGDDPKKLNDYAWSFDNSDFGYKKPGLKKPNAWGLYDMHGNQAEWVLDQYNPKAYNEIAKGKLFKNPLFSPKKEYPISVRGGSWDDEPEELRSAARRKSGPKWKQQDPTIPTSRWHLTDAEFVGFRIVRPLNPPENWKGNILVDIQNTSPDPIYDF